MVYRPYRDYYFWLGAVLRLCLNWLFSKVSSQPSYIDKIMPKRFSPLALAMRYFAFYINQYFLQFIWLFCHMYVILKQISWRHIYICKHNVWDYLIKKQEINERWPLIFLIQNCASCSRRLLFTIIVNSSFYNVTFTDITIATFIYIPFITLRYYLIKWQSRSDIYD